MCTLYERIIILCEKKGVAGSRMCLDLGLSKSTLSNMKNGRSSTLSTKTAQKIANYLGVTVGYLLGEEEEKEKSPSQNDELSENRKKLIQFAQTVPEDKVDLVIRIMKSILEET